MRVLVACEFSGRVREEYHLQSDCFEIIAAGWDLIIMHPPCTALAVSGNAWYGKGMAKHKLRLNAVKWTVNLFEHAKTFANKVALENPVGVLPIKASQYVQPWMFGHPESKKTGLWLHNLNPLVETANVKHIFDNLPKNQQQRLHYLPPSPDRWKIRSTTFQGIADAMAVQWNG